MAWTSQNETRATSSPAASVSAASRLGVVQGGELARGQAAFRLEFEMAQTRPGGQ
jgi:hypothetical protein